MMMVVVVAGYRRGQHLYRARSPALEEPTDCWVPLHEFSFRGGASFLLAPRHSASLVIAYCWAVAGCCCPVLVLCSNGSADEELTADGERSRQ